MTPEGVSAAGRGGGAGGASEGSAADQQAAGGEVEQRPERPESAQTAESGARVEAEAAGTQAAASARVAASEEWELGKTAMQKNLEAALAPATAAQYKYGWRKFTQYCLKANRTPLSCTGAEVATYLSYTAEKASGMGGVLAARAAIRHHFRLREPHVKNPANSDEVIMTMKGLKRRFFKPVEKKTPLKKEDFCKLLEVATQGGDFSGVPLCRLRLAAQLAVMYLTFSRFEECAALKCMQIQKEGPNLVVTFKKGKTYQFGEARVAVMVGRPEELLDPVRVVLSYMDRLDTVSGNTNQLLFPAVASSAKGDRSLDRPATYKSVLKQFKELVVEAEVAIDTSTFGLHSMRRGGVTEAINAGASEHAVMKQMRVSTVGTVHRYATVDKHMLAGASAAIFQ